MIAKRIHQLIEFVAYPTDHLTAFKVSISDLCNPTYGARIHYALNTPDFGWQFAQVHHETGTQLPADVTESSIRRAYWHLTGEYTDRIIQNAIAFERPACTCQRNILRAYLMCRDLSLEQISWKMQQPLEVISAYADLFWNVYDRRDEEVYLVTLAFPDTWIKQMCTRKLTDMDPGQLLLQLALREGAGMVNYYAGTINKRPWPESAEWLAKEFEDMIFRNARLMAGAGGLSQPKVPAIDMAVQLLNARRKGRSRRGACEVAAVGGHR